MNAAPRACRLCGAASALLADRGDLSLHRCRGCSFVSGWPARDQEAAERYAGYYHADVLAAPPPTGRYDEWLALAERGTGPGRLLEVGAGSGALVEAALRRGWRVDATEVSRSAIELLERTGARVFAGELRAAGYADQSFDLAVALEVIEHVPEPGAALRELCRVLRPGGRLLLSTPSFAGLSRRVLGLRWRVVDPEHVGYFTPRTLRAALCRAGFGGVQVRARGLDVTTWRRPEAGRPGASFDPRASAALRDRVNRSRPLAVLKDAANLVLGWTGLGDSLLAWARR